MYTVFHLLVVEVSCVLFLDHARWLSPKQNTRNFYHKRMKDGVVKNVARSARTEQIGLSHSIFAWSLIQEILENGSISFLFLHLKSRFCHIDAK